MLTWLDQTLTFPPVESALREPNGLLAVGGDLRPARLLEAYRCGIFPWFSADDPILWWSPNPRMVLFPDEFKVSRSLRKRLRQQDYQLRVDTVFDAVMKACAAPRGSEGDTWIHSEMIQAYSELHQQGYAHSVEIWVKNQLAGGLYGVAIGRMFYGESMFSRVSDGSKMALYYLTRQLKAWQFEMIDCQMNTAHLASLGARTIPRKDFIARLKRVANEPGILGQWQFNKDDLHESSE